MEGSIRINIFLYAFLSRLTPRRSAACLGVLSGRQRLDHLLLDILGLLGLLLLGSLRRYMLVDVLHHVRVLHEILLIAVVLAILVLLLLSLLRLLFKQEDLLDLLRSQI